MSDRQMARAAVDGRLITFVQELRSSYAELDRSISGFLVGMDDYHWLIVPEDIPGEDPELPVVLVHKSCAFVMISSSVRLSSRPESFRTKVRKIGERFWEHCKQAHLGYTATTAQESK
jgi:hypothetical protein